MATWWTGPAHLLQIHSASTCNGHTFPCYSSAPPFFAVLGPIILSLHTGRRIKFAPRKCLRFSELYFRILFSELCFTVLIPGAVEWIHKPPTAIFSKPIFVTNIRTALFEKEACKENPRGWGVVKCREFEKKNPLKWVVSNSPWENVGCTLTSFEKDPQNSNFEEISENGETFLSSKFDPATGVMIDWCCLQYFVRNSLGSCFAGSC